MKWGAKITLGMLVVSVAFSTAVLGKNLWMQEREEHKFGVLREKVSVARKENILLQGEDEEKNLDLMESENEKSDILPEYRNIVSENADFAGWISIEGTNIDYPVMQTPWEPEYYLHRNFTGEYSYAGVPFVGSGDVKEGKGDIFLYGHNMRNGTMFADLLKYLDKQYFEEHSIICLDTLRERRKYEVFAVLDVIDEEWSQENGLFFNYDISFKINREKYLQKIEKRSLFSNDIKVDIRDKLIFLVTCSYQKKNSRVIVVGRNIQ